MYVYILIGYQYVTSSPSGPQCGTSGEIGKTPVTVLDSLADPTSVPSDFGCHLVKKSVYAQLLPAMNAVRCSGRPDPEVCACLAQESRCSSLPSGYVYNSGEGCNFAVQSRLLSSLPGQPSGLHCTILGPALTALPATKIFLCKFDVQHCDFPEGIAIVDGHARMYITFPSCTSVVPLDKAGWTSVASSVYWDQVNTRGPSFAYDGELSTVSWNFFMAQELPLQWIQVGGGLSTYPNAQIQCFSFLSL